MSNVYKLIRKKFKKEKKKVSVTNENQHKIARLWNNFVCRL